MRILCLLLVLIGMSSCTVLRTDDGIYICRFCKGPLNEGTVWNSGGDADTVWSDQYAFAADTQKILRSPGKKVPNHLPLGYGKFHFDYPSEFSGIPMHVVFASKEFIDWLSFMYGEGFEYIGTAGNAYLVFRGVGK